MAPDSFTVSLAGNEVSLSPEEIERELSSMWKPLDEAEGGSVSRMVLGNVIWLGSSEDLPRVQRIIQKVVPRYPCRIFLLEYRPREGSTQPRATVNAQCFRPRGGGTPVCCELVHLLFGPAAARHVRGSIAPLLLGDLQTNLWLSLPDELFPGLADLQELADRTICMGMRSDSTAEHLARCFADRTPTFDLCWFRILPLREQMAAFFDDPANEFDLSTIRRIRLAVTRRCAFPQLPLFVAALLTGWLGSRLGWEEGGGNVREYRYESPAGPVAVEVSEVDEAVPLGVTGFRGLSAFDGEGRLLRLALGARESQLELSVSREDAVEAFRRTHVREMNGWESLGRALNAPPPVTWFADAAKLARPLLGHYCP